MNTTYYPEGMFPHTLHASEMSREQLKKAYLEGTFWRLPPVLPPPPMIFWWIWGAYRGSFPARTPPLAFPTAACGISPF